MATSRPPARRSDCPINAFVEVFGDRWSLLVVRDLMLRGHRTYKELQGSEEGIATNILADRLERLAAAGILESEPDPTDGRRLLYRLTDKGMDLAAPIAALALWSTRHEGARPPPVFTDVMAAPAEAFFADVRRRLADRARAPDTSPARRTATRRRGRG